MARTNGQDTQGSPPEQGTPTGPLLPIAGLNEVTGPEVESMVIDRERLRLYGARLERLALAQQQRILELEAALAASGDAKASMLDAAPA